MHAHKARCQSTGQPRAGTGPTPCDHASMTSSRRHGRDGIRLTTMLSRHAASSLMNRQFFFWSSGVSSACCSPVAAVRDARRAAVRTAALDVVRDGSAACAHASPPPRFFLYIFPVFIRRVSLACPCANGPGRKNVFVLFVLHHRRPRRHHPPPPTRAAVTSSASPLALLAPQAPSRLSARPGPSRAFSPLPFCARAERRRHRRSLPSRQLRPGS